MDHGLTDRLNARFDSYDVLRQLHDVPPHEVYEITVNGQRAIYKANTGPTGRAGMEGRVMAFVEQHSSVSVPETILVENAFYVASWHDDAPSPEPDHHADKDWAHAAGRGLARLHNETAPCVDAYGAFRPDGGLRPGGHDRWHAAAAAYVRSRRPVLAQYGHADMADAVLEYLDEHPDAFAGAGTPVCCHGWATPEHVAVTDGDVVCMIDFEHAIAAPDEYDYWRTVVPTFGPAESRLRDVFRTGYESVRSLPSGLERRRRPYALLNGVYYFESLYVQNQHGPEETAQTVDRLRTRITEILNSLS